MCKARVHRLSKGCHACMTHQERLAVTNVKALQILEQITRHIKEKQIDVVLYVDRFDLYRTNGTDHQVSFE